MFYVLIYNKTNLAPTYHKTKMNNMGLLAILYYLSLPPRLSV